MSPSLSRYQYKRLPFHSCIGKNSLAVTLFWPPRMWSGGAELTRDLWLANGRKDAATYQLTQVSMLHRSEHLFIIITIMKAIFRRGRRMALTFSSARLSPSPHLHLSTQPGSCQVIIIGLYHIVLICHITSKPLYDWILHWIYQTSRAPTKPRNAPSNQMTNK